MSVITCPSCNTPAPPGAVFCDHCGYDLRTVAPSPSGQPLPPTFMVPGAEGGEIICPVCQHPNVAGSAFCENCGAQLPQAPAGAPPPPQRQTPAEPYYPPRQTPASPAPSYPPAQAVTPPPVQQDVVAGRLVIQDSQTTLPIPPGKPLIIIGREDPVSGIFPDIDLDPHGGHEAGVGRRHAQLVAKNGQIFIEDLDSVNGTAVNRQRIQSHDPHPLTSGDEIRLGKMALIYYAG